MADRLTEKKEAAKKDEAYQPLWDTDQSIPEYMALLMGEQTQKNEDVELHEASDSEDSDGSNEPEDTSEDTPEQAQATHAYGEYVRLEHLGLQPGAILPVIPEPFFGIPDSELIEMRLLDRSLESSAPMQACAAHLNPVKAEENPISRAAELQPVGYVPINNPLAGSNIEEIEGQRTFWKAVLIVLLILNPFVLVPLVSMFDNNAGMSMLFFFIIIGLGSFFVVPILWIVGIVQAVKHKNRLRELIQKTKTVHAEFWYYLVYNRLPDDYTGINGYTKKHGFFDEYEALKRRERVKLRESAAPREAAAQREPAALHKPAAHPGSPDVEIQD